MQAPLEAQGRGFTHGHGKGHSVIGATLPWLRNAITSGLTSAVRSFREALCSMASTVQYDAAREPARQLGVDLRPEPFTAKQQRQSRMDGGEEEDGTLRDHVELSPPVEQPHVERECRLAIAESRVPRQGSAAYREVPLTGALQSSFPAYRQRSHFGDLGDTVELVESTPRLLTRRLEEIFNLDDTGQITEVLLPDGTPSTDADKAADTAQWATHFGQDVFNKHCSNHEHDCKETCVKYVKKQLEAKKSLHASKVPTCRFWFYRRVKVHNKFKRRRGKPLVRKVFIADDDDRDQEFRCQVIREQPFRSTSNDVCQATDSCNVDFQFLTCAPPMPPDDADPVEDEGADQNDARTTNTSSQGTAGSTPHVVKRRLIKKNACSNGSNQTPLEEAVLVPKVRNPCCEGNEMPEELHCILSESRGHGLLHHKIPRQADGVVDSSV